MKSSKFGYLLGKMSLFVNRAGRHFIWSQHAVGDGDAVIIFTKSRGLMDNSSPVCIGNIRIHNNSECLILELGESMRRKREYRSIGSYLIGEIFEEGDISPTFHIYTLELTNLLELGFFRIFVKSPKKPFM